MIAGLCAIAKNEALYLREWVHYHLALGFDKIYIYDNDSEDKGCTDLSLKWPSSRRVEVRPWPSVIGVNAQATAYDDFFEKSAASFQWVMILDVDEFLLLKKHDRVSLFLKDFGDAAGVVINWKMFGSSGKRHFEPGLVTERFTRASNASFEPNINVKTFFRPGAVQRISTHSPEFLGSAFVVDQSKRTIDVGARANILHRDVDYTNAQINHYFTKSYDEFVIKRNRGKADVQPDDPNKYRPMSEFDAYDRNEALDRSILETSAFSSMKKAMSRSNSPLSREPREWWRAMRALNFLRRRATRP